MAGRTSFNAWYEQQNGAAPTAEQRRDPKNKKAYNLAATNEFLNSDKWAGNEQLNPAEKAKMRATAHTNMNNAYGARGGGFEGRAKMVNHDARREMGKTSFFGAGFSGERGALSVEQQAGHSIGQRIGNNARAIVNVLGQGTVESTMNMLGVNTAAQNNMASRSMKSKLGSMINPALGAYMLYDAVKDGEAPWEFAGDTASMVLASRAYGVGQAVTAMFNGGNMARRVVGGVLGGGVFAAGTIATMAGSDLLKNESQIASFLKKTSTPELMASAAQNENTLTMRQRALQKMSNSAMNDRGQLLGSEAAVLRGSM